MLEYYKTTFFILFATVFLSSINVPVFGMQNLSGGKTYLNLFSKQKAGFGASVVGLL